MDGDPVVRPERLHLEAERVAQPGSERERPGRMHARAEGREDADPPVADLVLEALDDDRAVRRDGAGRGLLVAQEGQQVPCSLLVEGVILRQPFEGLLLGHGGQLARGLADLLPELVRATGPLPLPERDQARHSRRRRDEHPVAGDLLDAPGRGAEQEGLAGPRLVDHLLVELAHATAAIDEVNAVKTAVGNRPRVRDRELARTAAPADDACGAVPHDARPQLGELVGGVATGEHVEDVLELDAREVGEVVRAPDELVQLVDRDLLVGAHGHDLLGEHVQRVARDHRLLDRARLHPLDHDGRLEQVGAVLREDAPSRDGTQLVSRPTNPLQAAGDRLRRLDLDHEVDGAHVDAELERRGGDEARDLALLEQLLDFDPLLSGQRAVVGTRDLRALRIVLDAFVGQLVEPQREALGQPAVVDEDDGRPVLLDELQNFRVDRRPDRPLLARLAHVLERHDDFQVELLRPACVDELDRPPARDEAPDLLHRPLRGRQADPLDRSWGLSPGHGHAVEALYGHGHVRAPLRARHRVHLVEDQGLDAREHLAGARREHQVERLRGRDQDVGMLSKHRGALFLRRVTRADGHAQLALEPRQRAT